MMPWYRYVFIFVVSFIWIFFNTFNARNAAQGRVYSAIGISLMMGMITVFVQRSYMQDDLAAVCFMTGGSLGAGSGIAVHKRLFKKKDVTHG
jgi:FtsH-binding integral membrane protein